MELLVIIITASFILLESREVFQGMFSQPLITSLLLYFMGYDPSFIFATAVFTQLAYLNKVPSGAVLFPEYQFSYFTVAGGIALFVKPEILKGNNFFYTASAMVLIFIFSMLVSRLLYLKRKILGRIIDKETAGNRKINMGKIAILASLLTIFSGIFFSSLILSAIYPLTKIIPVKFDDINLTIKNMMLVLGCGLLPWSLLRKKNYLHLITGGIIALLLIFIFQ